MSVQTDSAFVDQPSKPFTKLYFTKLRLFSILGLIATILALFGGNHWAADLFAQFKFQWAFGLLVLAVLFLLARRWWWVLICLIGFGVNGYPILPYFASASDIASSDAGAIEEPQSQLASPARLLSLNVLTSNRKWDEVIDLIIEKSPDFVVLMEVDSTWEQVLLKGLGEYYPHVRFESRLDNFGIAYLSKQPWSRIEVFDSVTFGLPSIDVTYDKLGATVLIKPLRIIGTHPIPPMSEANWNARNEQLFNVAGRFDQTTPNIMIGDFNLSPWSPNFSKVLEAGGLTDSSLGFGPSPTWYVFPTWVGGLKIDHALVNDFIVPVKLVVGPAVGSDHRPLILDFGIRP